MRCSASRKRQDKVLAHQKEQQLIGEILDYLRLRGIFAWRQNAGLVVIQSEDRRRVMRVGMKGISDILGIIPPHGRFLAIEVKKPGRKPTAHQRAFLAEVKRMGGIALVAHSLEDVERVLDGLLGSPRTMHVQEQADAG